MIKEFQGEHRYLSNFAHSPLEYKDVKYLNAEAAFHAQKQDGRQAEFSNLNPSEAKRLGRQVNLRSDWEQVKEQIMYEVVSAKFLQNPPLMFKLIHTDEQELEEGNSWGDTYWGVCRGTGQNKLGRILMAVRDMLGGGL